jgi:hypothetical protein
LGNCSSGNGPGEGQDHETERRLLGDRADRGSLFGAPGGIPKTLEWKRKVKLDRGQGTAFKATLGPVQQTPGKQQE